MQGALGKMVSLNVKGVAINGKYRVLSCASFFYFRIPRENWEERADAVKAAGCNTVDVYLPWNFHETAPGQYRFDGDADVDAFLALCRKKGLMIIARPGPYICSEWDGGALPAWVAAAGNVRQADPAFLASTRAWFDKILPIVKKHEYDGHGGVILLQLDNELDFFDCPDPQAYIGALRDMALENGITVPLFACAGQLNTYRAGGLTEGVYPTFNFYPDSRNGKYDTVLRYYAEALSEAGMPLLISETHRDAFMLRREYAAGAKLLGAYNQVGGSNFGFTASINNWGDPIAFLTTQYDFDSLVTTLGEYSPAIDSLRIFADFLTCMGERGATAVPYRGDVAVTADFTVAEQTNALQLDGGGVLVCLSDFDRDGKAQVSACGKTVDVEMRDGASIFLPFDVPFGPVTVECANCEPLSFDGKTLVFHTDFAPCVVIDGVTVTADTAVNGIEVRFISEERAAVFGFENAARAPQTHRTERPAWTQPTPTELPLTRKADGVQPLDAVGVYRGYAVYDAQVEPDRPILLEDASDVVTAYIDGKFLDTRVTDGTCVEYPVSKTGRVRFVVEKWGNTNFDDPRAPSLRLTCRKGAHGLYTVATRERLGYLPFTLCDAYATPTLPAADAGPDTRITVNTWNTTRMPAVCAYRFTVTRTTDKVYLYADTASELCVYVNGKYVGEVHYRYFDLTPYCPQGAAVEVAAQYRKRQWAENVGTLDVLHLVRAQATTSVVTEDDFARMTAPAAKTKGTVRLEKGQCYLTGFTVKEHTDAYVDLTLRDCKATVTAGGRVIARIIGDWAGAPKPAGGNKNRFFLPAAWTKENANVCLFIECVGEHPAVEKIEIMYKN